MLHFSDNIQRHQISFNKRTPTVLQINIGRKCNLACHHCHVESGPLRTENMEEATALRLLEVLKNSPSIKTVDFTGGAPELNPYFKFLIQECKKLNKHIIDRCNLTVLYEPLKEFQHQSLADFLAENKIHIIASLPCYSKDNVEKQRGRGVFNKSIEALKWLNRLGYGNKDDLKLDLVYNPTGPFLPPSQKKLEMDYKKELKSLFDIDFNNLFTITNMPIKRFLKDLEKSQQLEKYMDLLVNHFNPHAASNVMCLDMVSISWDGCIYDCDFNQMLEMTPDQKTSTIWNIESFSQLTDSAIAVANHCYACTAGSGSSCGGSLTEPINH